MCVRTHAVHSFLSSFSVVSDTMISQEIGSFLCQQVIIKGMLLIIHMFIFWRVFSTDFNIDKYGGLLSSFVAA